MSRAEEPPLLHRRDGIAGLEDHDRPGGRRHVSDFSTPHFEAAPPPCGTRRPPRHRLRESGGERAEPLEIDGQLPCSSCLSVWTSSPSSHWTCRFRAASERAALLPVEIGVAGRPSSVSLGRDRRTASRAVHSILTAPRRRSNFFAAPCRPMTQDIARPIWRRFSLVSSGVAVAHVRRGGGAVIDDPASDRVDLLLPDRRKARSPSSLAGPSTPSSTDAFLREDRPGLGFKRPINVRADYAGSVLETGAPATPCTAARRERSRSTARHLRRVLPRLERRPRSRRSRSIQKKAATSILLGPPP